MSIRLVISCFMIATATAAVTTDFQGMMFLYRYGYITEKDMTRVSSMQDENTRIMMQGALQEFQERSGLNITGVLDQETMEEMSLSRCGVKDVVLLGKEDEEPSQQAQLRRSKRYVLGRTRWWRTTLTYRYIRSQAGNQGRPEFEQEILRAFRTWSAVSPLVFNRVTSHRQAVDINIRFAAGNHGDNSNFDGPSHRNGPVLAHAFYPSPGIGGDVHFDDEENWRANSSEGVDFFSVALHEVGHSIGLDHSTDRDAIMYPTYRRYRPGVGLNRDDIAGVQAHYGRRTYRRRSPLTGPATQGAPDLCRITRIDAAFQVPDSQDIYIFSGKQCYLLQEGMTDKTAPGFPRPISDEFPGVEVRQRVDAALAWPNGQVFIFESKNVWKLRDRVPENGYPKPISEVFPRIPDDLSAACFWPGDQLTYFFKGHDYWRYDNTTTNAVKAFFPRTIRRWRGVSGPVDAVLSLGPDTYFFQDGNYYRYSNRDLRVYPGYPRPTNENLFACNPKTITSEDDEVDTGLVMTAESSCQNGNQVTDSDNETDIKSRRKVPSTPPSGGKTGRSSAGNNHQTCLLVIILSFIFTTPGCDL